MKQLLLIMVIMAAALASCGKRVTIMDQPTVPSAGHYEITWVDPAYYYTDSLVTLIRSERVDSFYVDRSNQLGSVVPSISFEIEAASCNVAVSVHDEYARLQTPILVQLLPAGYYKLTLNPDRFDRPTSASGSASLRADICGHIIVQPFVFE